MIITGAFLALQAEIVDQALNVTGGVLDWICVPPPGATDSDGNPVFGVIHLVTLMQAGPDDHQKPYRMKVELVDPHGNRTTVDERDIAVDAHTGENRFWVTPLAIGAGTPGRAVLINSIEGGGDPVSIPIEVRFQGVS